MNILKYKYRTINRNDKTLVIFPDKPFWFIADNSIRKAMEFFIEGESETAIQKYLIENYHYRAKDVEAIKRNLLLIFQEAGLFVEEHKGINNPDLKFPVPVLNLTRNCNLACRHCYADATYIKNYQNDNDLLTNEWKMVIDQICSIVKEYGEDRILLTGGEPFLREDIIDLIKYIHFNGFRPFVNTNSLLITDEHMDILAKCKAELLISLDGATQESHEYLRGKDTFNKTIQQIKKLKTKGVITKLSFTVHSNNINEIEEFIAFAEKVQADRIAINNLSVLDRADNCGIERANNLGINNILFSIAGKNSYFFKSVGETDFVNLGGIVKANIKFTYCGVGSTSLCIDANGDVYPCYNTMLEEFKIGNVKDSKLLDMWKNSNILKELREIHVDSINEKCAKCVVRYYCGAGCRGETYYKTKNICSPYPFCEDMKRTIIDVMFKVGEMPELFATKVESYQQLKDKWLNYSELR